MCPARIKPTTNGRTRCIRIRGSLRLILCISRACGRGTCCAFIDFSLRRSQRLAQYLEVLTVWGTCGCRIFTEALIHGTTYWTGAQDRRLVSFKFCPGHVQYIPPANPMCSEHLLPFATSVRRPKVCCVANCATAATVEFVARRTCSGNCWTVHGWGGARWRSRQRPGSRCPCPTPRRRGRGGTRWQSTLQCWPSAARGCENGRT